MASDTDRVQKKTLLKASRARVWRALTDANEFGSWFGMRLDGPFVPGTVVRGAIVGTKVDPEIAKAQKPYEGSPVELVIERMVAEKQFAFRWHPYAIEPGVDYSSEPMTLIEFDLEEVAGGVLLTVTESGFDAIPVARRAKAFEANAEGWGMVIGLIGKHLVQTS